MFDEIKVLLPSYIWEKATDTDQLKELVLQYMRRYPDYSIKKVKGRYAICIKKVV